MKIREIINLIESSNEENLEEIYSFSFNDKDENSFKILMHDRFHIGKEDFSKIGNIGPYDLLSNNFESQHRLRLFVLDSKKPIGYLNLEHEENEIYKILMIFIDPLYRSKNIAFNLYTFILNKGIIIKSDIEQTSGSQALWKKLAQIPEYNVWMEWGNKKLKITPENIDQAYGTNQYLFVKKV